MLNFGGVWVVLYGSQALAIKAEKDCRDVGLSGNESIIATFFVLIIITSVIRKCKICSVVSAKYSYSRRTGYVTVSYTHLTLPTKRIV